jgi:hypothetical protein
MSRLKQGAVYCRRRELDASTLSLKDSKETHHHGGRRRVTTAKVVRTVGTRTTMGSHSVVRRGRSRTVRSTHARVVLRTAPREADARVADGIALHLIDGHLSRMTVDELNEATALSRRNLHVCDLSESLEEGAKLVLGDIAREAANEDGRVVRVGELVHGRRTHSAAVRGTASGVERSRLGHAPAHSRLHGVAHHGSAVGSSVVVRVVVSAEAAKSVSATKVRRAGGQDYIPRLRRRSANAHRPVATVHTLHLKESSLLIALVGEAHESVSARLSGGGVGHDLGGLARREASLEQGNKNKLVHLGAEVTDEDGVLGAALVTMFKLVLSRKVLKAENKPAVNQATTRGPVELEMAVVGAWDGGSVHCEGLVSRFSRGKLDETVSSIAAKISTTPDRCGAQKNSKEK